VVAVSKQTEWIGWTNVLKLVGSLVDGAGGCSFAGKCRQLFNSASAAGSGFCWRRCFQLVR